ncbi:MAG: hypothetical protein AB7S92_19290 [Parvibaculaceae bacterium]|jgi:hypothetical protein
MSQPRPRRLYLHVGRFLAAFVLVAALLVAAQAFHRFLADNIAVAGLFLSLMLIAALSAGRGLLTPSLKELAFYFFAIIAAGMMWPGAQLALSAYEEAGFVALAAFMIFVFALAVGLAVLSACLLAGDDGAT